MNIRTSAQTNTQTFTQRNRILLVDDDVDLLHLISVRLKANDFEVQAVDSAQKALQQLVVFKPDVVVTDLKMPGMDGMALFEEIQQRTLRLPVIVLTANGTIPDAVTATQKGVFSYLVKPFNPEILLGSLDKALKQSCGFASLPGTDNKHAWREAIITRSPLMEALLEQTLAVAKSDISILVQGQTGTGKELLAQAIHKGSGRRDKSFMALNCAAIPESLIESELFGHTAGSFTGANKTFKGLFLAAEGGTVFLDEIGDMPIAAQAKLLRVLEQREIRPLGSSATIPIDVRIIAATNQDLQARVAAGTFRDDLYYRLNVVTLELPTLRERMEDILLLADHFCTSISRKSRSARKKFSPDAAELLVSAPWPGNVRELYNVVEQCVVLSTTRLIPRTVVERSLRFKPDRLLGLNVARDHFEHEYLVRLLNLTEGKITLAAKLAGRNRSEFYNLLRRHSLEPMEFRKSS